MRRIVAVLESSPERSLSRKDLDDVLLAEGHLLQHIPRSLRALERRYEVFLEDRGRRDRSVVRRPREVRAISDDEIAELLAEISSGK